MEALLPIVIFVLFAALVVAVLARLVRSVFSKGDPGLICTVCGEAGSTKTVTAGSILIEIVLWMCFLIPGLIYSIWRLTTRRKVCRSCGAAQLVRVDSPAGRKLAAELGEAETAG